MGTLSSVDIMEAVEKSLNRLYPGEPVYWDYLPRDVRSEERRVGKECRL